MDHLTGRQIAAARALVGMTQAELAALSSISIPTLKRMEAAHGPAPGIANNVAAVRRSLEAVGIIFLSHGSTETGGVGIRVRDGLIERE